MVVRTRHLGPLWVALLALLLVAPPASAGIVNVQSILATEAEEGVSGAITGSVDWRTGNSRLLLLSAAPVARYRRGDHLLIGIVRGEFARNAERRIVAKHFEHLRYRYQVLDWLLGEAFGQHEYDEFRRLELRALVGAGPRITLLQDGTRYNLAIGVAYMLEYERLDDEIAGDLTDLAHRLSSYLVGSYQIDDRAQLVGTIYTQPRLTDPTDYRLLNESQLVLQVTRALSLTSSFVLAYDSTPPEGVQPLDTQLKTALTYNF